MEPEAARQEGGLASYRLIAMPGENVIGDARHFIYSKWLRSLRYENDMFRLIDAECYWATYQPHIRTILDGSETTVRLAVLSDEPDVLLGFSVSRRSVLDYVYVHKDQRRQGIAAQLVPQGIEWITHVTKTGLTIWGSHDRAKGWRFDPFR